MAASRLTGSGLAATATVLAAAAVLALAAAPASANFVAAGSDPVGDSADPHPARDIVALGLTYDRRTGKIQGGVRLAGEPNADTTANLTLFAGRRNATGCNVYPAVGFGTGTDLWNADWVRLNSATAPPRTGSATKLTPGATQEFEATSRVLAGVRPNCVVAQLAEYGNTAVVYDTATLPLRARPELDARIGPVPTAIPPRQTRVVRLTLRNPGDASTGRIRIGVAGARGLKVKMARTLPALRPGATRRVPVRVTLAPGARATTPLRMTAIGASGIRARADAELVLRKPAARRTPPSAGGGGGSPATKLCFRFTWMPPYSELVVC